VSYPLSAQEYASATLQEIINPDEFLQQGRRGFIGFQIKAELGEKIKCYINRSLRLSSITINGDPLRGGRIHLGEKMRLGKTMSKETKRT